MFTKHEIRMVNGEEVMFLYMNHDYEFGLFDTISNQSHNLMNQINQYMKEHKIKFQGKKISLVVNGILISSLLVASNVPTFKTKIETPVSTFSLSGIRIPEIKEFVTQDQEKDELPSMNDSESNPSIIEETIAEDSHDVTEEETKTEKPNLPSKGETSTPTKPNDSKKPENSNTSEKNPEPPESEKPIPPVEEKDPYVTGIGRKISIIRSNGTIIELALEDYIIGVVAGEMPASFSMEALKAQAVAARTYALKKLAQNQIMSDTIRDQVYKDISQMKKLWGNSFTIYYNKIKNAVLSTKGEAIYYQNSLIDAVYFSTSNGKTEDSVHVWGNSFPYLVSVDSPWDTNVTSFLKTTMKTKSEVETKLNIKLSDETEIKVLSKSSSGRINKIQIGDQIFNGVDLYNKLGLRSRDFTMWIDGETVYFETRGFGHGVGMSQYGANGMAKEGYTYTEILKHYYQGVQIR